MAKFKPGDKVRSSVDGKTYIAMEESRPGFWWLADLDGRGNGLETREIDLTLANSRACNGVRSRNAVVAKALNACAKNGSYDTLEIRKDPKYGNNWCVYQDGVSVRAVPRVFDSPEAAKKYVREQMPAWADAKFRVKNACGAARNAMDDAEAQRLWDDFQKKLAAVKRDADTLRSKFRADKHWAYAEQMGFVIQKLDDAVFK